jgi:hypothetical protein
VCYNVYDPIKISHANGPKHGTIPTLKHLTVEPEEVACFPVKEVRFGGYKAPIIYTEPLYSHRQANSTGEYFQPQSRLSTIYNKLSTM